MALPHETDRPHAELGGPLSSGTAPLFYRWSVARDEVFWVGDGEAVLGYSGQEMPRTMASRLALIHLEDRPATEAVFAGFLLDHKAVHLEYRVLAKGGACRLLVDEAAFIGEDMVVGTVRVSVASPEKELLAREERERAILDNSTAVIYVKGADGRYQFVNKRHAELFSLDRKTVIGKTAYDIYPREVADKLTRHDRQVLGTKETISIEEVVPHVDGNHTYVSVKFPLFDARGQVSAIAGISTDITDQLRAREADEQMRFAQVFQQKLYPARAPSVARLDVAGSALPVAQVCGDYFDYVLRDEHRLAVSLGDVSGHGFGPALQMVEVRATIRILLHEANSLRQVVEELNRALCVDLPESSFVSLFLAEVDAGNRELRYVGAGHQALLFKADGTTRPLDSTGPLLGIDESASFGEPSSIAMATGDVLVLFTDGLTEAMNRAEEQFGTRRLVETVNRHRAQSSKEILDNLFAAIYDFAKGHTLQDDMTAITVKVVE